MDPSVNAQKSRFYARKSTLLLGNQITADRVFIGASADKASCFEDDDNRLLQQLPYAAKAVFNHIDRQDETLCLAGTRTEVIESIMAWARGNAGASGSGHGSERIYWLNGMAGTGKSTIARTIARLCFDEERLGASFFFARGGSELETARRFVTTVAVQLAPRSPALRRRMCCAMRRYGDIATQLLSDQWKQLVLHPCEELRAAEASSAPLVIVVDALDECNDEREINSLLHLLSDTAGLAQANLLIFLTSRPDVMIRYRFSRVAPTDYQLFILHRIDPILVDRDITLFFEETLAVVRQEHSLPSGWPGDKALRQLVLNAGGLFIWAATACRFVRNGGRFAPRRLELLLNCEASASGKEPERRLDAIYMDVLHQALRVEYSEEELEEVCCSLKTVLGTIAITFSSLSAVSLARLLRVDTKDVLEDLRDLHSIFDVPHDPNGTIRPHHVSVRDFLLDHRRCTDLRFWVNEQEAHAHVARRCVELMDTNLKKDICALQTPWALSGDVDPMRVADTFPAHLRYACLYWVQHLVCCKDWLRLEALVTMFLEKHFLNWLEALSLLGLISDAVEIVALLESVTRDGTSRLSALVSDAYRFLLYNRQMIAEAPLQTHLSAIAFAPSRSLIRQLFASQLPRWLRPVSVAEDGWSQSLLNLEGHAHVVKTVVFSPDGQLVASGSKDHTIRIWSTKTCAVSHVLEGHADTVVALAFSHHSQLLASRCRDGAVRLWKTVSGAACGWFEVPAGLRFALAFGADDEPLVAGFTGNTGRLWGHAAGALRPCLEGHTARVNHVVFAPDGQVFASASDDGTARLWDAQTGAPRGVLGGHAASVCAVAYSANGRYLASASRDKTLRLWDVRSCSLINVIERCVLALPTSIALSPDGELLATGDRVVELRNTQTSVSCGIIARHSRVVTALAFSPDGQLLATASYDKSFKLSDVRLCVSRHVEECDPRSSPSLALSPDGQLLASTRLVCVTLWNVETATVRRALDDQPGNVYNAAFSPDSQFLATANRCGTIKLWSTSTGHLQGTLVGHQDGVRAVGFSPDGHLLASASDDHTVRLWDPATLALRWTLEGHSDVVWAVAFSPDGQLLGSASNDMTNIWDPATGNLSATLVASFGPTQQIAISPDNRLLASATVHAEVFLWNLAGRELVQIFRLENVSLLSFSPDSCYIVTNVGSIPVQSLASSNSDWQGKYGHGFVVTKQWLACEGKNLLWLPPDVRSCPVAMHDKTFAVSTPTAIVIVCHTSSSD